MDVSYYKQLLTDLLFSIVSCQGIVCKPGATCVPHINGTATCKCPQTCASEIDAVCGSDRKTYANLCLLKYESCIKNRVITVARKGFCGKCYVFLQSKFLVVSFNYFPADLLNTI